METARTSELQYIKTEGRTVISSIGAQHREQWQMIVFLLLAFGFVFAGMQILGSTPSVAVELQKTMFLAVPLMIYSFIVLTLGWILSWRQMSEQAEIKIIQIDDDGVTLGNKKMGGSAYVKVPWWQMEAMEIVRDPAGENEDTVYIATQDLKTYKLKWNNAFAWVEPETFFAELRTHAPNTMLNFQRGDIAAGDNDARYTNLWLQYFSSPDTRQRRGVLPAGTLLNEGRYRILKRLGGGGQGTVYLATSNRSILAGDVPLGTRIDTDFALYRAEKDFGTDHGEYRHDPFADRARLPVPAADEDESFVVLKEYVLPVHRGSTLAEKQYELLNSEARILSEINHPMIVKLFDCFVEDHRGYLVLDFINGQSLRTLVVSSGKLTEPQVLEVSISVCDILSYLHGFRPAIVHRDLTPDNLLVSDDGTIKLIDFTVAHQMQSTRTSTVVGKQAYIPPEQFRGAPTVQSDIYALGCTMFYLLTGQDPEPMQESRPKDVVPEISSELNTIVARATAFDIRDRYLDAEQLKHDLLSLGRFQIT